MTSVVPAGVYFGFAQVIPPEDETSSECVLSEENKKVHPMVMSLGWNPFYKNERLSAVCSWFLLHELGPFTDGLA